MEEGPLWIRAVLLPLRLSFIGIISQPVIAALCTFGNSSVSLISNMLEALHVLLIHVANAEHGFFRPQIFCHFMIGTGQDVHAIHVWRFTDNPALIAKTWA